MTVAAASMSAWLEWELTKIQINWINYDIYSEQYYISELHIYIFLSGEGPMLETLDFTIHISSTPTFSYFDLYLYSAYAAHYIYKYI